MDFKHARKKSVALTINVAAIIMVILCAIFLGPDLLKLNSSQALAQSTACTDTANEAFTACGFRAETDYHIALGNCMNLSDPVDQTNCENEAAAELTDAQTLCDDQLTARLATCSDLGEDPYDPEINPGDFVNPLNIGKKIKPNRYFPLVPGTTWKYNVKDIGGDVIEKIEVEVLRKTKKILGINCIVVRDTVWEIEEDEKSLIEKTHDWYAQDKAGNVWYFGELSREFEDGELISLEGSWKAGVDGAKAGILMEADPQPGDFYRQEFELGDAEDMAEVIGFEDSRKVHGKTYKNVLHTRDFTPIEPVVEESKYYAPRVGAIQEVGFEDGIPTGEQVILVKMRRK